MLNRIIRWLLGYVRFTAKGKYPERFINLLNRSGFRYWDFFPENGVYSGYMSASDYLRAYNIVLKSGVTLRVKKRCGLVFKIRKYRHRAGVPIGLLLSVILITILGQFVWVITISGAENLSLSEINTVLGENGLYVGAPVFSLDIKAIERNTQLSIDEIRWMSVNMRDNVAEVEIKEKHIKPKADSDQSPCNIKAGFDGVITKITVHNGSAEVKKGSAVAKNQLLVNSIVEGAEEKLYYMHADAEVYADVIVRKSFEAISQQDVIILNENYSNKNNIGFLNLTLPMGVYGAPDEHSFQNTYRTSLTAFERSLPVGIISLHSYNAETEKVQYTDEELKKLLKKEEVLFLCFNEGKSKLKSRSLKFSKTSDGMALDAEYIVNKEIGVKQKIKVVESE